MKINSLKGMVIFLISGLCFISLALAQETEKPQQPQPRTISVVGRLAVEKHGQQQQDEELILHAKNSQTYLITGKLVPELKKKLAEIGEHNLTFLTGNQDGRTNVSCERTQKYETDVKGKQELKIDVRCIRYYHFEATQIIFVKKSMAGIPEPKRDLEEERRMLKVNPDPQGLIPAMTGEIYGRITAVNFNAPIKTIEVANRDRNDPLKAVTLIISPDTRIAKNIAENEPMALGANALKIGQDVTAVYSRTEYKTEALFITITKE